MSKRINNYNTISPGSTSDEYTLNNIVGSQGYTYKNTPVPFNIIPSTSWVSQTTHKMSKWKLYRSCKLDGNRRAKRSIYKKMGTY